MPEHALPLTRVLKAGTGCKGDDVYAVSRLLKQVGLRTDTATREYGRAMAGQVGAYQYAHGLEITGDWGNATHKEAAGTRDFDQYGNLLLGNVSAPLLRELTEGANMRGKDVDAVARALWRLGYRPASQDRSGIDFGPTMADQTAAFQDDRGLEGNGVWGQQTHDQACALVGFDDYACQLLQQHAASSGAAAGGTTEQVRSAIVDAALLGADHEPEIHYTQDMDLRMQGVTEERYPPDFPNYADCSSYATWCYFVAGADDPNGVGYNGTGYTGTLTQHGRVVSSAAAADLAFYGSPVSHVAICVSASQVVSHGQESGPRLYELGYRDDLTEIRRYVG